MAKPKLKSKASGSSASRSAHQKSLMESAQQIWMAGMGALGRAQEEGSKLFEGLVKEGMTLEQSTRKIATGNVDRMRGAVENTVSHVKDRAQDTWDRLEKVFEDRVSRALARLGVPGRDELQALTSRVEELNRTVSKMNKAPGTVKAKRAARSSMAKAQRSVSLMAQAAGEMQDAATDVVKQVARTASSALKRKKR
jgi:poly(hydroxyalkanoate) granule-associated protein